MDTLEQKVAEFVRLHGLFAGAKKVLLAISGGADSIALLYVLESLRASGLLEAGLVCAHVNHKLRGPASDADERFVVEQATALGLPVTTRSAEVRTCAQAHGLSLETAGRQLRLALLGEMAAEHDCTWVATGHQKNDNAETVIHRLRRGTGLRGLAGIWPARQFDDGLWLARPLLCVTRDQVVEYLRRREAPWREDHTNVDLAYTRNYIRHRLLPALQQGSHRSLVEELSELAASARRLYERIHREAAQARARSTRPAGAGIVIEATALASLPAPVAVELARQVLVSLGCGERDLTQRHYQGILQLARRPGDGNKVSLPQGFVARYERQQVILGPGRPALPPGVGSIPPAIVQIPGKTRFAGYEIEATVLGRHEVKPADLKGDKAGFSEYLDLDRVNQPVIVRARQTGDRFQPLGSAGPKKVGKFLMAARIPREMRSRVLILADRERIIWVCPVRISEQAKVTETTQRILLLGVRELRPPAASKEVEHGDPESQTS